ncbi:MAG: Lrp/AsnC family transcriptional regulator [Thaumarchaeota archaeon]|nr:Lrp/AsnC family transcriptional regulator [Nitrososphaerota archaeon]
MTEIDEIDKKIIGQYVLDARQSYHQVAKKIGVAVSTVQMRTKRLEKEGIIKGYTAILDYEKLGLTLTAITEITTTGGKIAEVENRLAQMQQANAVYDVAGTTDVIIIGKFRSTNDLSKFAKSIQAIPNVNRTETHIVLEVVKEQLPKF